MLNLNPNSQRNIQQKNNSSKYLAQEMGNKQCCSNYKQKTYDGLYIYQEPVVSNFQIHYKEQLVESQQEYRKYPYNKLQQIPLFTASKDLFQKRPHPKNEIRKSIKYRKIHKTNKTQFDESIKCEMSPITFSTFCSIQEMELETSDGHNQQISDDLPFEETSVDYNQQNAHEVTKQSVFQYLKSYIQKTTEINVSTHQFVRIKRSDIFKQYKLMEKIGEGSFGQVFKCQLLKTGQSRAVKILRKNILASPKVKQQFLQQFSLLKKLNHPNILKIYQIYQLSNCMYIVSEICSGGSLNSYIHSSLRLSTSVKKQVLRQLFLGVNYLHANNILHRDIKPQNIVFINRLDNCSTPKDVDLRIIDFGLAIQQKQKIFKDWAQIGTPHYMAPQVFDGIYSRKSDAWACGVVMYLLLAGCNPFKGNTVYDIRCLIQTFVPDPYNYQWCRLSYQVKNLLLKLLEVNYITRIDIGQALKCSYFQANKTNIDENKVYLTLSNYYRGNNIIAAVETYLSFVRTTQFRCRQLANIFQRIDLDCNGLISPEELLSFLQNEQVQQQEINYIFRKIDKNNNGIIDFQQFVAAMQTKLQLFNDISLLEVFNHIDLNSNGFIEKDQLKYFLRLLQKSQVQSLYQQLDMNSDGKIDFLDFKGYIQKFSS